MLEKWTILHIHQTVDSEKPKLAKMFRSIICRYVKRQIHTSSSRSDIIKPASATHSCLKQYNLSLFDQITPSQYIPMVFYYPNKSSNSGSQDLAARLKRSLSETLISYYPFAGRLSSTFVDCNDEGVEFQEVDVERQLSEVLEETVHDNDAHTFAIPKHLVWGKVNKESPVLFIRLTNFECGGISIAVGLSHKLGDAKSVYTFVNSWAMKTRQMITNPGTKIEEDSDNLPHFISYPPISDVIVPEYPLPERFWKSERFVFPNTKIAKLKETIEGVENPSRVEVITALLHKCITTTTETNTGKFCPTLFAFPVNARHKMIPRLPETTIGNIYWPMYIPVSNESENNLTTLIGKFKKEKREMKDMEFLDVMASFSTLQEFTNNGHKLIWCTSLSRMQFYQVDFGFGIPSKVVLAGTTTCNNIVLTDTPDGDGLEALVSFDKEDMATFQKEKEIVEFTS
jgi:shikimate O-hydroxycinnamoyltransferase